MTSYMLQIVSYCPSKQSIWVETYKHCKTLTGWMAFIVRISGYFWPSFLFSSFCPVCYKYVTTHLFPPSFCNITHYGCNWRRSKKGSILGVCVCVCTMRAVMFCSFLLLPIIFRIFTTTAQLNFRKPASRPFFSCLICSQTSSLVLLLSCTSLLFLIKP